VLAGNKGYKMDAAKRLGFADEYLELDRADPDAQWNKLKEDNPHGFDAVVSYNKDGWSEGTNCFYDKIEATGNPKVANNSINFVRRGGKLLVYGVYGNQDQVHWSPYKIFSDEIEV
jgi:D-arabinitol dehydrogenase (NADP+)